MTTGCGFKADPLADEELLAAEVGVEAEELVLSQPRALPHGTARLARLHPVHLVAGQLQLWLRLWLWLLRLRLLTVVAGRPLLRLRRRRSIRHVTYGILFIRHARLSYGQTTSTGTDAFHAR